MTKKGEHHTEESNERNRLAHLGKTHKVSKETKAKMSQIVKAKFDSGERIPWNKGKTKENYPTLKISKERKHNISQARIGQPSTKKGITLSEELVEKNRLAQLRYNEDHPEARHENSERLIKYYQNNPDERKRLREQRAKQKDSYNSGPEAILRIALISLNKPFIKHKQIKLSDESYHPVDIFIEPNICIEADGKYWHSRKEQRFRDKFVNRDLRRQGMVVYRFPEFDITEGKKLNKNQREEILEIEQRLMGHMPRRKIPEQIKKKKLVMI